MNAETKLTVANPEIKSEYYCVTLDKSVKQPLYLLSDVAAFRLKKNAVWGRDYQDREKPLLVVTKENIRIYALHDQDFQQLTESAKNKDFPFDIFPVFKEPSSNNTLILTDQIIVHFQKDTPNNVIEGIIQKNGLENIRKSRFAPNEYLLRVLDTANFKPLHTANNLNEVKSVLFSAPNFLMEFTKEQEKKS